jgi:hypothetical protein
LHCSITVGTEIKQWTSYFAIQSVMNFFYTRSKDEFGGIKSSYQNLSQMPVKSRSRKSISGVSHSTLSRHDSASTHLTSNRSLEYFEHHKEVRNFLKAIGENPEMAPLLSEVLPSVSIDDNHFTKNIDGPSRCVIIKSMVIRIAMQVTQKVPAILIFDDTQVRYMTC